MKVKFVGYDSFRDHEARKVYWHPFFEIGDFDHKGLRLGTGWFERLGIKLTRGEHYPTKKDWFKSQKWTYFPHKTLDSDITQKITATEDVVVKLLQDSFFDRTNLELMLIYAELKKNM